MEYRREPIVFFLSRRGSTCETYGVRPVAIVKYSCLSISWLPHGRNSVHQKSPRATNMLDSWSTSIHDLLYFLTASYEGFKKFVTIGTYVPEKLFPPETYIYRVMIFMYIRVNKYSLSSRCCTLYRYAVHYIAKRGYNYPIYIYIYHLPYIRIELMSKERYI